MMSEDKLDKIETGLAELTSKLSELVGEFKWYHKQMDDLKVDMKDYQTRLRTVETKMPSLEEMKDNNNKIRNSVTASIIVAVIIGGVIVKFAGA